MYFDFMKLMQFPNDILIRSSCYPILLSYPGKEVCAMIIKNLLYRHPCRGIQYHWFRVKVFNNVHKIVNKFRKVFSTNTGQPIGLIYMRCCKTYVGYNILNHSISRLYKSVGSKRLWLSCLLLNNHDWRTGWRTGNWRKESSDLVSYYLKVTVDQLGFSLTVRRSNITDSLQVQVQGWLN